MKRQIADFLRPPQVYGSRTRMLLAAYFLVGLALVFLAAILFAGRTARRMDQQAAVLTRVFSLFVGETALHADRPGSYEVLRNVLHEVDFPIIITDPSNVPLVWHVEGVPPQQAEQPGDLARPDLDAETQQRRQRLDALVREFDAENRPYPIQVEGVLQGYLHYGQSSLSRQITWIPIVLVLAVSVFAAVGLLGFRYMKLGEQRSIWVGMARETAHQLGTPLTSLLGWVQLLRSQEDHPDAHDGGRERRAQTYAEMQRDLERLSKVSARFSKIGATPSLAPLDIRAVLLETVEYIQRRIPHLGSPVRIQPELEELPPVPANRELLEWAFENLLKNALDALESGGEIHLRGRHLAGEHAVEIRVADSGKGIPLAARNRVWQPGYTTKRRGWGLGLALVKRIVEDYHGGRIWIEDNPDRRGVCFAVRLPVS